MTPPTTTPGVTPPTTTPGVTPPTTTPGVTPPTTTPGVTPPTTTPGVTPSLNPIRPNQNIPNKNISKTGIPAHRNTSKVTPPVQNKRNTSIANIKQKKQLTLPQTSEVVGSQGIIIGLILVILSISLLLIKKRRI